MRIDRGALTLLTLLLVGCAHAGPLPDRKASELAASSLIDAFHRAASQADEAGYFALFAKDGVFLGTAAEERWSRDAFRAYVHPYFSQGKGWTYVPQARHLTLSPAGDVAWFDEVLTHEKYGVLRGSGVLIREADAWKVAQYNLTFTIPNPVAGEVVRIVRAHGVP